MARSKFFDVGSLILVAGLAVGLAKCDGVAITCPLLKKYDVQFMKEAGKELNAVQESSPHLAILMNDYSVTRDAIRKCIEKRKG